VRFVRCASWIGQRQRSSGDVQAAHRCQIVRCRRPKAAIGIEKISPPKKELSGKLRVSEVSKAYRRCPNDGPEA
jgi:hypothetical protein